MFSTAWKHRLVTRHALLLVLLLALTLRGAAVAAENQAPSSFPRPLSSYSDPAGSSLAAILKDRVHAEPFNVVATVVFALAILHTFAAPVFLRLSHRAAAAHLAKAGTREGGPGARKTVSFRAEMLHFLGEVEAVFGIWVIPLLLAITLEKGWLVARDYVGHQVNFTEPMFVVVIMTMAASRPVLGLAEQAMAVLARLGNSAPAAWWFSILTIGPLLGSFITEPAAMTISAMLLGQHFYSRKPPTGLAYATLGLLFVNVSVGGTLTHFAAPPVLMVAAKWDWGMGHMLAHFGWKAALGIVSGNLLYLVCYRRAFQKLAVSAASEPSEPSPAQAPPMWITTVHLLFLAWTVLNNHYPVLFVGGFLFYIAFTIATAQYQQELALRPALLVGFFLAGLVIHGGLQAWWIQPVLASLGEVPLFLGATVLTAFNDNAAITYLASLVPGFTPALQHAVVAGAVVGGGLTVIANAPNPAGQSILARFFPEGVSPSRLFLGALLPTVILAVIFLCTR